MVSRLHDQLNKWFLDYASYVILERAVPHIEDGLKPVQRRILHSMHEMEDGRYNKVQTIVGHTAKYHPHGDMAVKDALVNLGNKNWLIDRQGSWGNLLTGDGAAAGRYIEARLSPFAKKHVFSPKVTESKKNYDGRFLEPVFLPSKVPLLLMQGAEGIAVGLSCQILPHNFSELMDACIGIIHGKPVCILPDFAQGGLVDASEYRDGARGGRVKCRARIRVVGKSSLEIYELPAGVTTVELKESLLQASLKGTLKLKEIRDHTTSQASIFIDLPPEENPEKMISALYAFTKCEVSLAVNAVVIKESKAHFTTVSEILSHHVQRTRGLLQRELEIALEELEKKLRRANLEKLFIQHRIYKVLEAALSPEKAASRLRAKFKPHGIALDDNDREYLLGLPMRRLARFNQPEMDATIAQLQKEREQLTAKLKSLTRTLTQHFESLREEFGGLQPRRSTLVKFKPVAVDKVEPRYKVNVDHESGFVGTSVKGATLEFEVTRNTDLLGVSASGCARINRVLEREFFGAQLIDLRPFDRDADVIYNLLYTDCQTGRTYAKRFRIDRGLIRNKEYPLTRQTGDIVHHFSRQKTNEKPPIVTIRVSSQKRKNGTAKTIDFSKFAIKGMGSLGYLEGKTPIVTN